MKILSISVRNTNFQLCILIMLMKFSPIASEAACKVYDSTRVDCSYRELTTVPRNLPSSATHLDLSYNYISSLTPNSFKNLQSLEVLTMWISEDLNIDSDTFVGLSKLRTLAFTGNGFITFGKNTFKHLPSLQELHIPIKAFVNTPGGPFSNLINLSRLTIRTQIPPSTSSASVSPPMFQGLGNLRELSVKGWSLGKISSKAFIDLVNLKQIHFSIVEMACRDIEKFNLLENLEVLLIETIQKRKDCNISFSHFPFLKEVSINSLSVYDNQFPILDLSSNNLRKLDTIIPTLELKAKTVPPLLITKVSQLRLSARLMVIDLQTFLDLLTSVQNVVIDVLSIRSILRLSYRHNLTETTFKGLAQSNLQELDISQNALGTIATDSFKWLSKLQTLKMDICYLDDESFMSLRGLSMLTTLTLQKNRLQNFRKLVSNISEMKNLRKVDVSENLFSGQIPIHVFQRNQALASINLSDNKFTSIHPKSFICLLHLEHLDLSNNKLEVLADGIFSTLLTLNSLLLSGNILSHLGEEAKIEHPLQNLNNLTSLKLTLDSMDLSNINLADTPNLESLHIDGGLISTDFVIPQNARLEKLRSLVIENVIFSLLSGVDVILTSELINLQPRQFLRILLLPNNNFNQLNFTSLNKFRSLIKLSVANSKVSVIIGVPDKLTELETLDLSQNLIMVLSSETLTPLSSLRLLKVYSNPFDCSCKMQSFEEWLERDKQVIVYSNFDFDQRNLCSVPTAKYGVPVDKVEYGFECNIVFIVALSLTCFVVIVLITVTLVKRFHWHMHFAYFLIKLKLGGYQLQHNDEEQPISKQYDAFVVYNEHDSDWVIHELVPHLENIDPPNFKLCIHERDFIPGNDIFDNILDSIEQSKKTMLILSPHFAASEWCYFEMRMAQSCLFEEKRDIIVMISLKKIPDAAMPRILRNILLTKRYLEWPANEIGRRLFWEKLKVALKSDSRVNRVANL